MNTIQDNSTFTSIRRCLVKESSDSIKAPYDLENFLHFITTFILSESITIQGFVHEKVSRQRDEAIEMLKDKGIDTSKIPVIRETEDKFKEHCRIAANMLVDRFKYESESMVDKLFFSTNLNQKISEHERSHASDITTFIVGNESKAIRKRLIEHSLSIPENRDYGAVGYMIASNDKLFSLLQENKDRWSIINSQRLINTLRYQLNFEYKTDISFAYAPNTKRSRQINGEIKTVKNNLNERIVDLIDRGIIQGEPPIRYEPVNLPGISRAILYESKGDLDHLLDLINIAHEDTEPLRNRIAESISDYTKKEKNYFKLENELNNLANRIALGKRKILNDGPKLESILGIPYPSFKNMEDIRYFVLNKKDLTLLSEFAEKVNFPLSSVDSFRILYEKTIKN